MTWESLLFEHWPVPPSLLRPLVPPGLELDTRDGSAWLAVVPFAMRNVRLRGTPALPWVGAFPELNVRTYVRHGDRPGVWFFSLDADQPLAVMMARRLWHLGYRWAAMRCAWEGGAVEYRSRRRDAPPAQAEWRGRYAPAGSPVPAPPGSLAHFLTARYCLYAEDRRGRLYRGEIDHPPWRLETASAEVETDTMTRPLGFELPPGEPLRWFSRRLDVVAWPARRIAGH
jgi:uncharacterized protein YqjF (DUF2071 family)